jgi:hypothetical protein
MEAAALHSPDGREADARLRISEDIAARNLGKTGVSDWGKPVALAVLVIGIGMIGLLVLSI